jgi:peptide/nickel transport system substrate-binding protein
MAFGVASADAGASHRRPLGASSHHLTRQEGTPMQLRWLIVLAALVTAVASAPAADAKNVLRWASQGDALTFDPHAQNEGPTNAANSQVYEPLVRRNARLEKEPGLAASWRLVNPTTWEFKLQPGVKFHDGSAFTAEDVAFSFQRAQAPSSDFKGYISSVTEVKAVDAHTVHILTRAPNPILPDQVTNILIMDKGWAEKHSVTKPQDYKNKEETYAIRNANGTGPFRLHLREPGVRTVMVKNPDWWGLAQDPHNIDEIVYTPIAHAATRVAALLSGELDFLLDPPLQDIQRIRATAGLKVTSVAQIRSIFFGMDVGSKELRSSAVKGKNPFADRRVRQAVYQAIDIEAIKTKVMRDLSVPAGIITTAGVHGYAKALDTRLPHDPAAARKLLAEAGYPDGFTVRLDCPNDRYNNDEAICQAVVGMLGRVGIKVNLDVQSKTLHFPKIQKRESDFYLLGWGVPTLDSHYVFNYLYQSKGGWNATRYANGRIDELTAQIETETDPQKRDALIATAWQIVKDDIVYVPLHHQVIAWAMRQKLDNPIAADDMPRFRQARFR